MAPANAEAGLPDGERSGPVRAVPAPGQPPAPDQLLARVGKGDDSAFAALYDALAGAVYGMCQRILRDPAQAEEVAQEVLVEVWRTAPRYDPERGSALTWVMTVAHRRAVDRVRSEQSARDREVKVGRLEGAPPADVVSEEVVRRFEHQQVRAALDQLTALQREALELAYYGGHTYREVAELLGAPLGTVKTRLRDGLIRLRDALSLGGDPQTGE